MQRFAVFRSTLGHKKSVTSRDADDLALLPIHRARGDRPIAPKPRQHSGADGVRRARVSRGGEEAQGDHFPLPSSSGMKMRTETP
jgi:hypothetical protein